MKDSLKILYSRPGMYIPPYDQKIDAAGFITEFLTAIFYSLELSCPDSVYITVAGTYLNMEATECWLDREMPEFHAFLSVFDAATFREPAFREGYVIGFIRHIVWFSEYCLANIAVRDKMFQQAFWRTIPFPEQPSRYLEAEPPRLGFCITLPPELFPNRLLEIERLRRVIDIWEKQLCQEIPTEAAARLRKFDKHWTFQSKHHFSLRLSPRTGE